ncbi:hypothetical protein Nepgr_007963 [Nepenthes gracilis]|uniref:Transmembrane protein n=1 Tax=Nepenthes gracilis TaxID=150966 RepID=A0AAD3S7U7_NEPGR|nr:hypothetical protein Nepgr_007963 [Nepenthes gracilis]
MSNRCNSRYCSGCWFLLFFSRMGWNFFVLGMVVPPLVVVFESPLASICIHLDGCRWWAWATGKGCRILFEVLFRTAFVLVVEAADVK